MKFSFYGNPILYYLSPITIFLVYFRIQDFKKPRADPGVRLRFSSVLRMRMRLRVRDAAYF